jgi:hypothetical protein
MADLYLCVFFLLSWSVSSSGSVVPVNRPIRGEKCRLHWRGPIVYALLPDSPGVFPRFSTLTTISPRSLRLPESIVAQPRMRYARLLPIRILTSKVCALMPGQLSPIPLTETWTLPSRSSWSANHPFRVPFWFCIPMYGWGAKPEVWVFLVSFWQAGLQCGYYVGIGGQSAYVREGEMVGAVKGELKGVPRRSWREWSRVEATRWLFLVPFLLRFTCLTFLL